MSSSRQSQDRPAPDSPVLPEVIQAAAFQTYDPLIELEQIGFLPTAASPVLYRALGQTGFLLVLHLPRAPASQTLDHLATCTDRTAVIDAAVAVRDKP